MKLSDRASLLGEVPQDEGHAAFEASAYRDQAAFRSALRSFLLFSDDQAKTAGITPQQYLLLLNVRGHDAYPHVTVGDIAAALHIQHHAASRLVDRSLKEALLQRVTDPDDRRRAHVSLTAQGQRVLDSVMEANRKHLVLLGDALFRGSLQRAMRSQVAGDNQ